MKTREILLAAGLTLLLGFLLCGCMTPRRAVNYLEKKSLLPGILAAHFPVRDSVITIPGRTVFSSDTTVLPGEIIPCPDTPRASVQCPPSRTIHDTVRRVDTIRIIRENTAKTAALQLVIARQKTDSIKTAAKVERLTDGRNGWRGKALWTWGLILALGGGYLFLKSRTALISNILSKFRK